MAEIMTKQRREEPTPIERLRLRRAGGGPGHCAKLMAKRPDNRYQTPSELAEALRPFAPLEQLAHAEYGFPGPFNGRGGWDSSIQAGFAAVLAPEDFDSPRRVHADRGAPVPGSVDCPDRAGARAGKNAAGIG